jgi:hypothetical protein
VEVVLALLKEYGPFIAITMVFIWVQYQQNRRCENQNRVLVNQLIDSNKTNAHIIASNTNALENHTEIAKDTLRFLRDRLVTGVEVPSHEQSTPQPTSYRRPRSDANISARPSLPETDRLPVPGS